MISSQGGPAPGPGIADIAPYTDSDSRAPDTAHWLRLSSNESAHGPSPLAVEAYHAAADTLRRYPDSAAVALRKEIAAAHGIAAERIVCGDGSDELLSLIAAAYLREGDEAVITQYGFLVYAIAIKTNGAVARVAPDRDLTADTDAILAAVTPRTRIVFLANPNNPTGTYLPADEIGRLHKGLPGHVLLVLDAAYAEYVRAPDYDPGKALVTHAQNVVMTRTFSKAYGLAGLRVGWAYCPAAVADVLNRIRGPFNVNASAQAAARAALQDTEHLERAVRGNEAERARLARELTGLDLAVTPSATNFMLVHFASPAQADAADSFLRSRQILLRRMAGYGLPKALRLTVGLAAENGRVIAALGEFLNGKARAHG